MARPYQNYVSGAAAGPFTALEKRLGAGGNRQNLSGARGKPAAPKGRGNLNSKKSGKARGASGKRG